MPFLRSRVAILPGERMLAGLEVVSVARVRHHLTKVASPFLLLRID